MNIIQQLGKNEVLITTIVAWTVAQTLKVIIGVIKEKHFDFRWFVGTGGMPSSHTAGACAMAVICGILTGFDSVLFGVAFLVTLVTMFDAQGVRRAAGTQAEILNKIVDDIYLKKPLKQERLKELLGHTPVEVIVGAIIGIIIAVIMHTYVF